MSLRRRRRADHERVAGPPQTSPNVTRCLEQESVARYLLAAQSRGRAAAAEPRRPSATPPFERRHDGAGATLLALPQVASPREPGDGDCLRSQRTCGYAQRAALQIHCEAQ